MSNRNQSTPIPSALTPAQVGKIRSLEVEDLEYSGSTGTITINVEAPFLTFSAIVRALEGLGQPDGQ